MTARDNHLADVRCHCEVDEDGHPLGTPGCASVVKVGNRASLGICNKAHADWYGRSSGPCTCHGPARGTCPECDGHVRVVGRPERRPAMARHHVAGRECPGTGRVPVETTYTPPAWAGRESEAS